MELPPCGDSPDACHGILAQSDLIYHGKISSTVPELLRRSLIFRGSPKPSLASNICNARGGQITASISSPEPYQVALSPSGCLYPPKIRILAQELLLIIVARARARHVSPRKREPCV
jgi:hypothetical protein